MGCGNSKSEDAAAAASGPPATTAPTPPPTTSANPSAQHVEGAAIAKGKGKGKGKLGGKGKGGNNNLKDILKQRFQIELSGKWTDYSPDEDSILKRAFLVGHPNAKYNLRGQHYEYNFKAMNQQNLDSHKERKIRPPHGLKPPAAPLIAPGSMVVVTVPLGAAGSSIEIPDPNNPGRKITVSVPPTAKPGAKMAVPVPEKGESMEAMVSRQKGYSTGAKVAIGGAGAAVAVGALAVGGVILGEHLTQGALSEWAAGAGGDAGAWAEGAAGDAAGWAGGAAGDVAGWVEGAAGDAPGWVEGAAGDAGAWVEGAAGDTGAWVEGAGGDAAAWTAGAAEDTVDWLGDAAGDVGDFVMSLF